LHQVVVFGILPACDTKNGSIDDAYEPRVEPVAEPAVAALNGVDELLVLGA